MINNFNISIQHELQGERDLQKKNVIDAKIKNFKII